ncbi:MAG TPA: MFS transporter, partial [Baekduia sp.]
CSATLMTIVDETIVSVASPRIQDDLGFSTAGLSWVVDAYLVAFGSLLLLGGRIGDLVGRRTVLLAGLSLFTLASALCAAAWSPAALVVARFVQGAGAALAASVALGMVVALFDDAAARARAIGVYSAVGASGASIGLVAGGLITAALGWRWAFLVNVPIGVATVLAGRRILTPETGPGLRAGADAISALLLTAGTMTAILAIVDAALRPLAVAAVVLLVAFVVRQARVARPLLPLRIFRSRTVRGANATHALLVGAMFGFQFLIALHFQRVWGYTPAQAGLAVVPVAAGIGVMSLFVVGRVRARIGAYRTLLAGLALVAAGLLLLVRARAGGGYLDVLPSIALFAVGGGLTLPTVMSFAMEDATGADSGLASGLINTSQQVGGAFGLAILTALATSRAAALRDRGTPAADATVAGYHLAWTVGGLFVLAALAVAAVTLRPRPAPAAAGGEHPVPTRGRMDTDPASRVNAGAPL